LDCWNLIALARRFCNSKCVSFFLLDQKEPKSQASFLAAVPLPACRQAGCFFPFRRTHGPLSGAQLFGVLSFTQRSKKTKFQDGTKKRAGFSI
jgi:hypothetical protein